jgi:hypothetical protein
MSNRTPRMAKLLEGNGSPILSVKPGRNKPCVCGSGKKAKKCCGAETKFYDSKPTFRVEPQNKNITENN